MSIDAISSGLKYPEQKQNGYAFGAQPVRQARINAENKNESVFKPAARSQSSENLSIDVYEKQIQKQNELVRKHELAHQSFSGRMASGSPVYETTTDKDGRLIITGGHQGINVPSSINEANSLKDINFAKESAKLVIAGAEAPQSFDALSDADKNVAAKGRTLLAAAETAQAKRLSLSSEFGINPEQKLNLQSIEQIKSQKQNKFAGNNVSVGQKLNLFG